ncbi:unnamed protein product [Leptosia nina]|uniref:Uncharacterized protein n=1 Tax=Leptosia nina TaxID=320188 RepID=A0AAV1JYU9_9NEOP
MLITKLSSPLSIGSGLMFLITTCVALCINMALSSPLPAVVAPVVPPVAAAIPGLVSPVNAFPFANGRNPAYPGYNGYKSPYYNPASATAPITSYSNNRGVDGSYSYSFTTGDGKQAQESGFLKDAYIDNTGSPQGTQVVEGSYAYTSPEGTPIQVNYVADENGFRPSGVHIPADGKGAAPALLDGINRNVYDPRYNAYTPINYRNPLYNQYSPARAFDPRFNPYNPYHALKDVKKTI